MTDALEQQLVKIITDVSSGIGEAKDFVVGEIPDVAQQVLMWYGVYNFILFIASIVIAPLIVYTYTRYMIALGSSNNVTDADVFCMVGGGITIIGISIAALININLVWLKIWIAPKLFLIEYAGTLVGGK